MTEKDAKRLRAELATLLSTALGGTGRPFTMLAVRRAFHMHLQLCKHSGGEGASRREARWAYEVLDSYRVEFIDELPAHKRCEILQRLIARRTDWAMPKKTVMRKVG